MIESQANNGQTQSMIDENFGQEGFVSILHRIKQGSVLTFYQKNKLLIDQMQHNGAIKTIKETVQFFFHLNTFDLMTNLIQNLKVVQNIPNPQFQMMKKSLRVALIFVLNLTILKAQQKQNINDQQISGKKHLKGTLSTMKSKVKAVPISFYNKQTGSFIPNDLTQSQTFFQPLQNRENIMIELRDLELHSDNKKLLFIYYAKIIVRLHNQIHQQNLIKPHRKNRQIAIICMCLQLFLILKEWFQVKLRLGNAPEFEQSIIFKILCVKKGSNSIIRLLQDLDEEALKEQEQLCLTLLHKIDKK